MSRPALALAPRSSGPRVAALFVEQGGPYFGLPEVDPWDELRDARQYPGPLPVVAHPPCKRWGRYWGGGPSAKVRRILGDDGGCFAAALFAVRTWGGVIEHPEASHAWPWFGLTRPPRLGSGWSEPDRYGGRSCAVTQGRYGHRARKLTWLYAVVPRYPALDWSDCSGVRVDAGFHSSEERRTARAQGAPPAPRLSASERILTPIPFRDLLLSLVSP